MKPTNKFIQTMLASLTGAAVLFASSSEAATFNWTNTAATASFVNAANWTNTASPFGNGVPVAGDTGINNIPGAAAIIGVGDAVVAATLDAPAGIISVTDGELTATTIRATGSNGVISVSGGVVNLANLQITGNYGVMSFSGGTTTVTTDSRIAAGNAIWNVSGGTLNLSKHTIGSAAAANTNNVMTVSGNAVVTQNQGSGGGANRELWIGGNNAGSGTLILKDNATWTSSAANGSTDVIIGRAASGTQSPVGVLTIQDNASLVVQAGAAAAKVIRMADISANASGTVNLNGGNISAIGFQRISGTATINVSGGKITALAAGPSFFRNFAGTGGNNSINLQAGGLSFDTSGFAVGITNILSGAGGLTKLGSDTLTLSAANTYTGGTVVSNGTLALTGVGSINASSSISVHTSSTLDVSAANAQLSSAGTLTLNDGTFHAKFSSTNVTVGTLGTVGTTNIINITALPNISSLPAQIRLIKYTTAAPGLVDGGNVLTTLGAILPSVGSPVGYLTNNVANSSIDLVITSMVISPVITKHPAPDSAYGGYFAHFAVELEITNSPSYQWRKGGSPLSNAGAYSGVNTAVLKVSSVTAAELGNYDVVVANVSGSVTSSVAGLTLRAPVGFEAAAVAAGPAALYMFDDTGDPSTNNSPAFDFAGDLDGIYGIAAQNGHPNFNIAGPRPGVGFPGFDATNIAARTFGFTPLSHVTIPALNLNTNSVTLSAWINPGTPAANAGLVFCRGGGTVAGLNFTASLDGNSYRTLGYTWNNEGGTFGWNSQIAPTPGQWSFVALVITPTNATIYIFDASGLRASSQTYPHVNQSFSAGGLIGDDGFGGGNRQFDGTIDGVGIYAKSLSQSQLEALYSAGSGVATFAPIIWLQPPASLNLYEQQNAVFSAGASGSQPLTYQWQYTDGVGYFNVANGGRISGATTPTLTISNLVLADATNFVLVVTNISGSVTSSVTTLTVNPVGPAENITNAVVQPGGQSWETPSAWSDGLAASVSAASKPGSSYYVSASGALRTPAGAATATFPGNTLEVQGSGFYGTQGVGIGAVLLKSSNGGIVNFPKLIMAGGEIFNFIDSGGSGVIGGEVNVISNTPIFAADDTSSRSIRVEAKLTGNGTVEYRAYSGATFIPANVASLNIAGTNNTYTGTWNVVLGTLVGSAPGSLGTNTITVGAQGALQTTYHINNPNGAFILNGRCNLTRNHTFKTVTINDTPLGAGTYTFAQLNTSYPANFPATWTAQPGALTETSASGSITVIGSGVTPIPLTNSWNGTTLTLSWPSGWQLLEATNVLGPWTTNSLATSPFNVTPTEPQKFFRLQAQ